SSGRVMTKSVNHILNSRLNKPFFRGFGSSSYIDRLVNLKLSVISMGKLIALPSMV
ncbi:MAG: hypothetical protein ACI9YE_002990, partial [Psychroserpens sp.]